jgi:hypothetical protein
LQSFYQGFTGGVPAKTSHQIYRETLFAKIDGNIGCAATGFGFDRIDRH